jgi:hypothetical protein
VTAAWACEAFQAQGSKELKEPLQLRALYRCLSGEIERQAPQSLAGRRIDCIRQRRECRGAASLAQSARLLGTIDEVDLYRRRLVHAKHPIGVEVGLLHPASIECDLPVKRRRHAEDEAAFELRPYRVGIDRLAAIHGGHNAT